MPTISLRITDEEKQQLEAVAKQQGLSLTTYIKGTVFGARVQTEQIAESVPDESELDRRARLARAGKGYALRMTDNGRKPWIGGSRLEVDLPNLTKQHSSVDRIEKEMESNV